MSLDRGCDPLTADEAHPPIEQQRLGVARWADADATDAPSFDVAVGLLADLLGAHQAMVSLVAGGLVSTTASTCGPIRVPRDASIAELAFASPNGVAVVTITRDHRLADHPALRGLELPVTCGAVAVPGPAGEPIGAVEVVWPDHRTVEPDLIEMLSNVGAHARDLFALHAEAREYRRFIELSPDPVTVLDDDGAVCRSNAALAQLLGLDGTEDLAGRPFLELVDRRDRTRATSELARVMFRRNRTAQLDVRLLHAAGGSIACSISAGNLRGTPNRVQLVVHDLSDRLRGEDERTQLSEQLARAQRLDAVGQIAQGLAHDLNNLLVIMVSNLSLAEESLGDADGDPGAEPFTAVRQDLAELRLAVDRAGQLTSKLAQFAQRADPEYAVASVAEVVETVQGLVVPTLASQVTLVVDVAVGLPPVAVDPTRLERVLLNLVLNARDAMLARGTVRVLARSTSVADGNGVRPTGVRPSHGSVLIEVVDDGQGMDASTQARAFEPLFTTKGEGGSGLGLATVAALADEVDGSVRLDSEPGRGTRVSLVLPCTERTAAEAPIGGNVPVAGARVLLVDPGERTRRVIARMLQGAGYRVTSLASAEEALRSLDELPTDLLIAELSLPGKTGVQLLAEVRLRVPALRAVMLAAVEAPLTLDGTPVLVKPFSHTRLLRTVEVVLQQRA